MKRGSTLVATGKHGNGVLGKGRDGFRHGAGTIMRPQMVAKAATHHHGLVALLGIGIGKGQELFYKLTRGVKILGIGVTLGVVLFHVASTGVHVVLGEERSHGHIYNVGIGSHTAEALGRHRACCNACGMGAMGR